MKTFKNYLSKTRVINMLLTLLAVVFGGGVMAAADGGEPKIGSEGPNATGKDDGGSVNRPDGNGPGSGSHTENDPDPVDLKGNDRITPGGHTAGQDLTGTQMSSSQVAKGGLQEDEWDANIVKYKPFRNPLLSIARQVSKRQNVSNYSVKHMRVGGETLEVKVNTEIKAGDTIKLTSGTGGNVTGSLRPFYKGSTVFALGVDGYKKGKTDEKQGQLMLFVVDSDKTGVTLMAVNGPAREDGVTGDDLDYMTCPAIPAGTILSCGASAASESQLMISPENYQPREHEVYLQKKLLNIVWTDDFEKVKKRQPLKVQDIKEDAIYKYNMRAERTYWEGVKARFNVQNNDGSVEYVYTSEGILSQIVNSYALNDNVTIADLVAISKLQFTDFSESNHAYAFCGKDAMAKLLLVDITNTTADGVVHNPGNRQVFEHTSKWGLDFTQFKTTFGTLDFVWDQTLDMLHLNDCMVILDLDEAIRYVKISQKEQTNDMTKGAGEIREAKRFIHQEADAVALRGYNSIIVGPSDKIFNMKSSDYMNEIVSASSLPDTAANGALVALTQDYKKGTTTYKAGKVYVATVATGGAITWNEYKGIVTAG